MTRRPGEEGGEEAEREGERGEVEEERLGVGGQETAAASWEESCCG